MTPPRPHPSAPRRPRRRRLLVAGAGALAALSPWAPRATAATRLNGFDLSGALVPQAAIERGGPPRDGIPAIDAPRFMPGAGAALADEERVLGLQHGGVARAYPVAILNWHELVNDLVAGEPLLISWCPLCGTGMAFERRVGGRELRFGVSGLLYNSDVLMYDRETESLWSQIMAQAVTGPLKGSRLTKLPLLHTSWGVWRARHPDTALLTRDTGHRRDYGRDPYAAYAGGPGLMFEVQARDARLPAKTWVLGLVLDGQARAWTMDALRRRADARGVIEDRLAGRALRIELQADGASAEVRDAQGRPLPSLMAYWFAWYAFHPGTELVN